MIKTKIKTRQIIQTQVTKTTNLPTIQPLHSSLFVPTLLRHLRHCRIPLICKSIEMHNAFLLFLILCTVSLSQEISKLHSFAPPFNNYAWSGEQFRKLYYPRKPQNYGMDMRRQRQH